MSHLAHVLLVALCSTSVLLTTAQSTTAAASSAVPTSTGVADSAAATNASDVPDLPKVKLNVTGASFPQNLIR